MFTNRPSLLSALISLGWVALVTALLFPVFKQPEEVAIQYRITGADGLPASYLTHFNFGWHYWVSYPVYKLQQGMPGVNMFAVALVSFQWVALTVTGSVLIKKAGLPNGILYFLLYLLIVSVTFLQFLTLTGTSIQLAIAGITLLWPGGENIIRWRNGVTAAMLFILAGLLRMHALALVLVAAAPFIALLVARKGWLRIGIVVFIAVVLTLGLNQLHVQHHQQHVPGWSEQEAFRQAYFRILNSPLDSAHVPGVEAKTFRFQWHGVIWDTMFVSTEKLTTLFGKAYQPRVGWSNYTSPATYWLIKNNLYLIAFYLVTCMSVLLLPAKSRSRIVAGSFWTLSLLMVLFTWFKLSREILHGVLGINLIFISLVIPGFTEYLKFSRPNRLLIGATILFFVFWGMRVGYNLGGLNRTRAKAWEGIQREFAAHPQKLFVVADETRMSQTNPIWRSPVELPCSNVLDRNRKLFFQKGYIDRYFLAINNTAPAIDEENVLFVGDSISHLQAAYPQIQFSEPLEEFKAMPVRRVVNSLEMED